MSAPFETNVEYTHSESVNRQQPELSVLVPFFHDNPLALMKALETQTPPNVELLFYDDGTQDAAITKAVTQSVKTSKSNVTLITAAQNRGRAIARNTLQETAKANWVLFLDADMRPSSDHFIATYLSLIDADIADVIFGGFSVADKADSPDRELHRALSQVSDCLPLIEREAAGPQFVATSNLCVKKSVLKAEPFDNRFKGWGWEDSEWAARVAKSYRLKHIDNNAIHLGLETDLTLLNRFKSSANNYKLFTDQHPELAENLSLYRLIKKLAHIPAQGFAAPLYRLLLVARFLPMRFRILALKLWRASWYARVF